MQVLNVFHVLIAIAMVAFVLVQRGAGATAGAAFGSGASGTVFGARGAGSFLSRTTWILATLFCAISLTMAVIVSRTVAVPENDLGVVASPDSATQQVTAEDAAGNISVDLPGLGDSGQDSDLPELDTSGTSQAPGDLPNVDAEAEEASESDGDLPGNDG